MFSGESPWMSSRSAICSKMAAIEALTTGMRRLRDAARGYPLPYSSG